MAGWSPLMKKETVEKQQGLLGRLRPWIHKHLGSFDLETFSPEIAVNCLFSAAWHSCTSGPLDLGLSWWLA